MIQLLFALTVLFQVQAEPNSTPTDTNACTPSCGGNAYIQIDVRAQCMCIGEKCFKVGIGYDGASMTTSGHGKIKKTPPGEKYQTHENRYSTEYDDDALAMDIPENDTRGKWLHKPRDCAKAETYSTEGCIAVPCDMWPLLKQVYQQTDDESKKELTVCNGRSRGDRLRPPTGRPNRSDETKVDQ